MKVRILAPSDGFVVWCPGCQDTHRYDARWSFNGDVERPTFSPSLRVGYGMGDQPELICHSFLTSGTWSFLDDTTKHELRGEHPAVDLPSWWTS